MTVAERFQGACANPAWLTLASAFTFGPASLAMMICMLIRMLDDIGRTRLLAATTRASDRADQMALRSVTARAAARLVGTTVFAPPADALPHARRHRSRTARRPSRARRPRGRR
jgi:xanthine/uracil permease